MKGKKRFVCLMSGLSLAAARHSVYQYWDIKISK